MTRRAVVIAFVAGVKVGAGFVGLVVLACHERAAAAAAPADEARAARDAARIAEAERQRDQAFALAERWKKLAGPEASCDADLEEARELARECRQFGLGGEP